MARKWADETEKAQGLHKRERYVLCELGKIAGKDGRSWYRQDTLAARLAMSVRTLRTALANLEGCGWIARERDWHRTGKKRGCRKADVVQLRTLAEAAAWVAARLNQDLAAVSAATVDGGGGDGPGPGVRQPQPRRSAGKSVNTPTRRHYGQPLAAAADRAPEPAGMAGDIHDLARKLQAAGQEVAAELAEPPRRRATG